VTRREGNHDALAVDAHAVRDLEDRVISRIVTASSILPQSVQHFGLVARVKSLHSMLRGGYSRFEWPMRRCRPRPRQIPPCVARTRAGHRARAGRGGRWRPRAAGGGGRGFPRARRRPRKPRAGGAPPPPRAAFGRTLDERFLEIETPAALATALARVGADSPSERTRRAPTTVPSAAALPSGAATIHEALWRRAEAEPERPHAHVREEGGEEHTHSYGRLLAEARAIAGGLRERGIGRGDRVALMLPRAGIFSPPSRGS
jgi:hypothetical protein